MDNPTLRKLVDTALQIVIESIEDLRARVQGNEYAVSQLDDKTERLKVRMDSFLVWMRSTGEDIQEHSEALSSLLRRVEHLEDPLYPLTSTTQEEDVQEATEALRRTYQEGVRLERRDDAILNSVMGIIDSIVHDGIDANQAANSLSDMVKWYDNHIDQFEYDNDREILEDMIDDVEDFAAGLRASWHLAVARPKEVIEGKAKELFNLVAEYREHLND